MSTLPSNTDPCESITTYPDERSYSLKYEAEILLKNNLDIDPILSLRRPNLPTF
jgi:hypothetical protein